MGLPAPARRPARPREREPKERLFRAVAARGQAYGLEAASRILDAMAANATRVVGTNTVKETAEMIRAMAREIRSSADAEIAAMEAASKT